MNFKIWIELKNKQNLNDWTTDELKLLACGTNGNGFNLSGGFKEQNL